MVIEPSRHDFRGEQDAAGFFDDIRGRRVPGYLVFLAKDETGEPLLPWLSNLETSGRDGLNQIDKLLSSRRFLIDIGGEELKLPPTALSHGYQSMIAWICELIGHGFLNFGDTAGPTELTGVVLLDEIDLHLPPTWQRRIVPVLKQVFSKLQFIVTTHSPLVLTGFEKDEIIELGIKGGKVVQKPTMIEPGIMTASEGPHQLLHSSPAVGSRE